MWKIEIAAQMKYKALIKYIVNTIKDPVFIVAFVVASLLLFFTKLDGQYTVDINIPISIEGVEIERFDDKGVSIESNNIDIGIKVKGNGYKILQTYFSHVTLPAESFISAQDSGKYVVDMSLFERLLSTELKDVEVLKVFNHTIPVKSVVRLRKEVPVRDDITMDLGGEYMQMGKTVIEPSTVWVSGSKRDLDNVEYVSTMPRLISNIESHISGTIPLRDILNVRISEKEVYYTIEVERFTEYKQKDISIQIKGYDSGERYITLPATISVTYNMTKEAYKNFKYSNITYYADVSVKDSVGSGYLGDNNYAIFHTELPTGVEIRKMSSDKVVVLKSK
ncbi:MAG: YbbR-like domain-containing protein [Rikenellaceae bacterium]